MEAAEGRKWWIANLGSSAIPSRAARSNVNVLSTEPRRLQFRNIFDVSFEPPVFGSLV